MLDREKHMVDIIKSFIGQIWEDTRSVYKTHYYKYEIILVYQGMGEVES